MPATYTSSCDVSAFFFRNDYIYLYGLKLGQLTAAWSIKASSSIVPAGMTYCKDAKFLYFFSHDLSNLFLSIINNWSGTLVASEI
jgi:hypothetical protein